MHVTTTCIGLVNSTFKYPNNVATRREESIPIDPSPAPFFLRKLDHQNANEMVNIGSLSKIVDLHYLLSITQRVAQHNHCEEIADIRGGGEKLANQEQACGRSQKTKGT